MPIAVGSNSVLVGLLVNLFVGLSMRTNVVIAQYIGQRRTKEVGTVVHASMPFFLICSFSSVEKLSGADYRISGFLGADWRNDDFLLFLAAGKAV